MSESNNPDVPEAIQKQGKQTHQKEELKAAVTLFETVDDAEQFILREPYKDNFFAKENLVIHLNLMKFNPYLEWYNTLLLYQFHDFSNAAYVAKTLDLWMNELDTDQIVQAVHRTEIHLLTPTIVHDQDQDRFEWQLKPFYLISNAKAGDVEELYLPIHSALDIFDLEVNSMILNQGWQTNFLQNFIEQFRFIQFEDKETKQFYLKALLFIFQNELHYPERVELMDTERFDDPLKVYQHLHCLVANLPRALLVFLQTLKQANDSLSQQNLIRTPESRGFTNFLNKLKNRGK